MDFEKEIDIFHEHVTNNYEMSNELVVLKYNHTLMVTRIMALLCHKLKLSDEDINLALHIALFHDLGRFEEVKIRQEFNNIKFDHAVYSNKVLFENGFINNFNIKESDYELIKKANYYHNKKDLGNDLDEREEFFCKLIRDADRMDIFRVLTEHYNNLFDGVSSDMLLEQFYNGETIDIKDLKTRGDRVLLRFGFVKLFSFPESNETLREIGFFEKYVESVRVKSENRELFEELVKEIRDILKGVKNYVRKKV